MSRSDLNIIQSPEAEIMRQMVTEGFYDRSRIGLWMFEIIGREYDDMAQWSRNLRKEIFPQTCTWSIDIWEFVYGIESDDSLALDYRRARLMAKRLSRPPINPAHIEAVLSKLTGCPVYITENIAPYTFLVEVDESGDGYGTGAIYNYKYALERLREIKPSHLSFRYERKITAEYTVNDYSAGALSEILREYFIEELEIITGTTDWDAVAFADRRQEYLTGDESQIQVDAEYYNAGAESTVLREYITEERTITSTISIFGGGVINELVKEAYTE